MKTDDLIAALAADTRPQPGVARRLRLSLPPGLGVSALVFALFWGFRPDLGAVLASAVVLKTLVPLALAALALGLALALVHPAAPARPVARSLLALLVALGATLAVLVAGAGLPGLSAALWTPSLWTCLVSIPALSLPLLAAMLWAMSAGAPLRPALAGAVAGLVAGAGAATIYSLFCDQDRALFVLPAYGAAIALIALGGALAGGRLLRW